MKHIHIISYTHMFCTLTQGHLILLALYAFFCYSHETEDSLVMTTTSNQ